MQLTEQQIHEFREIIWEHSREQFRQMPWRQNTDPYWVVVSELMLQQTQVERVVPKFKRFIAVFPDFATLATAPLANVLSEWVGLGYNRRAQFLHRLAQAVVSEHEGSLPQTTHELIALPGIGKNTAGAVMNYAFNIPTPFVETNVRTVFIRHFYDTDDAVDDSDIITLVNQTLDAEQPREWFWAIMDYGTYLKKKHGNNIRQSRHYKKQSSFEGSRRQVRGKIIRELTKEQMAVNELAARVDDSRFNEVL